MCKEKLYVITTIFNPVGYNSRYTLYNKFKKYVEYSGAELVTIELIFGNEKEFAVTTKDNPLNIQLRVEQALWYKENLINIAVERLPKDAKYIAWIDADVTFTNVDWVEDTILELKKHDFIQMFTHAYDLNKKHEVFQTHIGFIFAYNEKYFIDDTLTVAHEGVKGNGHPGYAWAATLDAFKKVGGLIDFAILGSADNNMAFAMVGDVHKSTGSHTSQGYTDKLVNWQQNFLANTKSVGYLNSSLMHYWHGSKKNRGYQWRWKILIENDYNPQTDLIKNNDGLILLENKSQMVEQIFDYFKSRAEDE